MQHSMNKPLSRDQMKVPQRPSTSSPGVEQLPLAGLEPRRKPSGPVDVTYLKTLPSLRRAVAYSLSLADMDPKEAYGPLEMDKATWSRIINGQQEVPASLLKRLKVLTGNDATQQWQAFDWGCELVPLRTELEARLETALAEKAELERRLEVITNFVRSTR